MNDLEISKALALAIGWHAATLKERDGHLLIQENERLFGRKFDYRDWNVIGPIAERYDCFPKYNSTRGWMSWVPEFDFSCAGTPQKAIAMAVIEAKKP